MRRTVIGAGLVLLAGVVAADAQGIGYGPGVNPSNPQDLRYRSNPQDLSAPGGSNRQDLVRRPPDVNVGRSKVTSVPTSYTVKTKPKQKPQNRRDAAATGREPPPRSPAVQGVPTIDIAPSCRASAKGSVGMQEYEACLKSELAAREILVQQWSSFLAADRGSCYRLTTTGTPGTYTEFLTCLEMKRDARKLNNSLDRGID